MAKLWTGYMDGYLKSNLDAAKDVIAKDWDMVFAVDGYEGSGKSVLAQQCAKYVDETFNINRICFTPKEFIDAINAAEPYQSIVYDEAYGGMSSRSAMTEVNKTLMGVLAEIRQKNLWVFIVLPCFFELDKYAAVWRSRALLHVYTGKNFQRGFFSFYNQQQKKNLYIIGKKFYSYKASKPNFFGRFVKGYTVDDEAYRSRKLEALKGRGREEVKAPSQKYVKKSDDYCVLLYNYKKETGKSSVQLAKQTGYSAAHITTMVTKGKRKVKGEFISSEVPMADISLDKPVM